MIASTRHSYYALNPGKASELQKFVAEYSRVAKIMVGEIWDRLPEDLGVPLFQDYKSFSCESTLSARALQCASNQAAGIVKASVEKQRRRLWVRKNRNSGVADVKFARPEPGFVAPQLNANCVEIRQGDGHFAGFIKLSSIGMPKILIPVSRNPQFAKWRDAGAELLPSVKLFRDRLQLSWKLERGPKPQGSKIVGVDQGMLAVATLSDGQVTPAECPHGHSLASVIGKLARKKKGSKSFGRARAHRKNFVNWSINRLDLSGLAELRLEKVVNIRKGVRSSRKMSHWSNPEIRDKIKRRCEELEVPVVEQSCAYRSQRCSSCGLVRKASRKGKTYSCKSCGFVGDADFNAALNHEEDLEPVPAEFRVRKLNLGEGFFWKPEGFFSYDGPELLVPDSREKIFQ